MGIKNQQVIKKQKKDTLDKRDLILYYFKSQIKPKKRKQ